MALPAKQIQVKNRLQSGAIQDSFQKNRNEEIAGIQLWIPVKKQ